MIEEDGLEELSRHTRIRYLLTLLILITIPCYLLGFIMLRLDRGPQPNRPTPTGTATITVTASITLTPYLTRTASITPTATATYPPTDTPEPSLTPTQTPIPTETPLPTSTTEVPPAEEPTRSSNP